VEREAKVKLQVAWPPTECPIPGEFRKSFNLGKAFAIARQDDDTVPARPADFTLDKTDGLFPVAYRAKLGDSDDIAGNIHLGWDGDSLLIFARVRDDRHFNVQKGIDIWNGDCLQIAVNSPRGDLHNVALALTSGGVEAWVYDGADILAEKNFKGEVVRNEAAGETTYYLRLPLAFLGIAPRPGSILSFNANLFDDDTGDGFRYWRQLTPGLAGGLDTEAYHRFYLAD